MLTNIIIISIIYKISKLDIYKCPKKCPKKNVQNFIKKKENKKYWRENIHF